MNSQLKNDLIIFAATCGMMVQGGGYGFNEQEKAELKKMGEVGLKCFEQLVNRMPKVLCGELLKSIKTSEIAVIPVDQVRKRIGAKSINVKREYVDDLVEQALTFCEDCKRDYKRCRLRKTLKKIGVEPCHDEKGKCEYRI